jgi:hypothetical protein
MYLVQMTLGCGFCHEFPDALVEGALNQQIDYLKQGGPNCWAPRIVAAAEDTLQRH